VSALLALGRDCRGLRVHALRNAVAGNIQTGVWARRDFVQTSDWHDALLPTFEGCKIVVRSFD
jgi:hypothetical protein